MRVQVKASNPSHSGAHRAGRFFANGALHVMEVIENVDPATLDKDGNGPIAEDGRPDMTRISRANYERLKADTRLSIYEEGGSSAGMVSADLLEAARRQASDAAGALSDATIKIEGLKLEVVTLKAQLATAQAAATTATASAPPAPVGDHGAGGTDGAHAPAHSDDGHRAKSSKEGGK
jgi:hypothetical protein